MNIRLTLSSLVAFAALCAMPGTAAGAQIFVTTFNNNTIGEYTTSGATINSALISSGLSEPSNMALSGGKLFVANDINNTIGEYNATTGATINSALISGLNRPFGIAVSGANLFVANSS